MCVTGPLGSAGGDRCTVDCMTGFLRDDPLLISRDDDWVEARMEIPHKWCGFLSETLHGFPFCTFASDYCFDIIFLLSVYDFQYSNQVSTSSKQRTVSSSSKASPVCISVLVSLFCYKDPRIDREWTLNILRPCLGGSICCSRRSRKEGKTL